MSKKNILVRTNIFICLIIIVGFILTAILSYRTNYSAALENIEQVSSLTSEGIYYQLSSIFSKPVNVSLTMANDSLLKEYLSEEQNHMDDMAYADTIREYLDTYRNKYNYDSVFLVSAATQRYYNFNGIDRVLTKDNPENAWYYSMMESDEDYSLNVDNDEVTDADNNIAVFVNCKIKDNSGNIIGIVGVGLYVDYLQQLLEGYKDEFNVEAYLVGNDGTIEISSEYTGYKKVDLFDTAKMEGIRRQVLEWEEEGEAESLWTANEEGSRKDYVVARYIPELSWHLVVVRNTGALIEQLKNQIIQTVIIIAAIIVLILWVINYVIKKMDRQIVALTKEQEETFRRATEQLYDNIYELNISKNCTAGASTERYFESLGVPKKMPYNEALKIVAGKQLKEEFREGYISTFNTENVMKEYEKGNTHLRYDFMMHELDSEYYWMRIDAYIYYCNEDKCIHMFTYRKNIDNLKKQQLQAERKMQTDEMTGLYAKMATQQLITAKLKDTQGGCFAFIIFDIDNFKQANDQHGHVFGDFVIQMFAGILKDNLREGDIIGRIGGDEFAAFIPIKDEDAAAKKAQELSGKLECGCHNQGQCWHMSASIGVALAPEAGEDFETLYRNADTALYQTKQQGKNGYTIYKAG